jgi:hypothetical protein
LRIRHFFLASVSWIATQQLGFRTTKGQAMTDQAEMESVTRRLSQALDMLDAAVERRLEIERSRTILAEQVHALDADRSKLAADLDVQVAKVRSLESVNREIARRLDAAMENVRLVLESQP